MVLISTAFGFVDVACYGPLPGGLEPDEPTLAPGSDALVLGQVLSATVMLPELLVHHCARCTSNRTRRKARVTRVPPVAAAAAHRVLLGRPLHVGLRREAARDGAHVQRGR